MTGTTAKYQRQLTKAIKRARQLALCPIRIATEFRKMKVILKETITGLGSPGDLVSVKAGYGRNFLMPSGKAIPATEENLKVI